MTSQARATQAVVEFFTHASLDRFPPETIPLARHFITDGLGCILAGSSTRAAAIVRDQVKSAGEAPAATVLGLGTFRCQAASAALTNGTAGHALDFDDTQLSTTPDRVFGLLTHPTVPTLVAALAVGERLGATGRQIVEAYLTGFEVECKVADAIDPGHYAGGFHSSGTVGTFGAMTAAARLLDLDAGAYANALGIASSMASGIRVNFGTMTKPLHVGRAAQNGLLAAELAARGFTAGADALDGPWGFFKVFGFRADLDPARIIGRLGNPHSIVWPGVAIKPYPCGVLGHPSMDAMLRLVTEHDLTPDVIRAVRLRAGSNILNPLRYRIATSELEAKFCPAFMLSSIALRRRAGIREFTDDFVRSPPVQQMMRRVETIVDPEIEARGFDRIRSTIEIDLEDGRTLVRDADERYRGGPDRPFTREELHAKFTECAELVLPSEAIRATLDVMDRLELLADVGELVRAMQSGPGALPRSSKEDRIS